jgi:hypothetical protein
MKKQIILLLTVAFTWGCNSGKNDSKLHFTNTIESSYAWTDHPATNMIWSNDAHSGNYVCKLDSSACCSATFNMKLSDISKKSLKSVHITAWINLSSISASADLILDVRDNSQKTLDYISTSAMDFISQPNQWVQVSLDANLDEKNRNKADNYFRVFVANSKPDYALVDDIELEFTEK